MIVPYHSDFKQVLNDIFKENIPKYFEEFELKPFLSFLESNPKNYYVYYVEDQIIGCGGYVMEHPDDARIVWFLFAPDFQFKGHGRTFFTYLEQEIAQLGGIRIVSLMTSQYTNVFYEKLGYQTKRYEKSYWGPNLDLYYMEKSLS